ncbi:N-acetylmuramoyl-L-alanine amidase [Alteribacillus sp. HJP-4]|uniref:N-acetylmuramoyl-L-alanine amidase n=1 Tax=Alteribacillus sp. HJP-4 TaxID=2775394 RepID=UPI0035CCFDFF
MRKTKHYMTLSAAAAVFSLPIFSSPAQAAGPFSDVGSDHWADEEIQYLTEQEIVSGREDGSYGPGDNVSRAHTAKMMSNALSNEIPKPAAATFPDVSSSFWAYDYIEHAADLGVFTGKNDGTFQPNNSMGKAHVAATISRAFFGEESESNNTSVSFTDISSDHWASGYIATLVDHGIIEEESEFSPNQPASRSEISAYLARAMNENLRLHNDNNDAQDSKSVLYEGEVSTEPNLNVRNGPGTQYTGIGSLPGGSMIDVYDTEGDWLEIKYEGQQAYVHQDYVIKAEDVDTETPASDEVLAEAQVTTDGLNVRDQPDPDSESLDLLNSGDMVTIHERSNEDWVKINYGDNHSGYVHSYYLSENDPGESSLSDKTIVIDAGHGASDSGAEANGLVEKELNLGVALEVEDLLEEDGVDVVMTREDDSFLSLDERVSIAEDADADSYVSIHANAAAPAAEGAETYYNNDNSPEESYALAESIQEELTAQTSMNDRRTAEAEFLVIKNTTMSSSLIELGFMTNAEDASKMSAPGYEAQAANAVYDGIVNFYD